VKVPITPAVQCPSGVAGELIELRHGAGGAHTQALIDGVFRHAFDPLASERAIGSSPPLTPGSLQLLVDGLRNDSALLELGSARIAMTTDGYVVTPLFFEGGNIGSLAVIGTCNDLAMVGAEPRAITAAFVLEEGLPIASLRQIVTTMAECASEAGVRVVAGDTKVVERGKGDGVYVTTTGLGIARAPLAWAPLAIRRGDAVLVSGDLGRHGVAVLCAREGLDVVGHPATDCAALWPAVNALLDARVEVHCLRDLTRGGLGTALLELARAARVSVELDEAALPVIAPVADLCELLGLDPIYVACEGRFVAFVPEHAVDSALVALRGCAVSAGAKVVGRVHSVGATGNVQIRSPYGTRRPLDGHGAEQLPRIC
jgi:hydrogenase expression/formation protein HypE